MYRLEGKDIVIDGFEQGIADTPYQGISDMRNMEIISVPKESSVTFTMASVTLPPVWNAVAFTAQNTGDTITVASTTGLYNSVALKLVTNSAGGLSTGIVYYVGDITATTFKLYLDPDRNTVVVISSDGSGTLTTYQYGNQRGLSSSAYSEYAPVSYCKLSNFQSSGVGSGTLLVDFSNYLWFLARNGTTLIFLGNIGGVGASSTPRSGVAVWQGYVILIGNSTMDAAPLTTLWSTSGPAAVWDYGFESSGFGSASVNGRGSVIVSQEDENLYWCTNTGIASLIETPGDTFDPADPTSYTINDPAIALPVEDRALCIAELGSVLLIGATGSTMYVWDKLSLGFSYLLNLPDTYVTAIIPVNQNAYAFAGNRGRIYITNGSSIELYKKITDYITGIVSPYIIWRSAYSSRNQLYFGIQALDNSSTAQTTVAGTWAIDLASKAFRMLNKITNSGYSGFVAMITEPGNSTSLVNPSGNGLTTGWTVSTTYGVDVPSSNTYTSYESYIDTDMIPVGTFLSPFSPTQFEWKTSTPLVSGEGVKISWRKNFTDSFTQIGESTTAGVLSDLYKANFQKVQWAQFRIETKSTNSTPSRTRLTEIRLRDYPSQTSQ